MQADSHPFRSWRKQTGCSLAKAAAACGITPSHLSEIERGLNRPSLALAGRLSAFAAGIVSIDDFNRREQPNAASSAEAGS